MEWVNKNLGEVCRLINGRAYKKHEMLDSGPYPLLRVGNFFSNRSWYYSDLELDEDKYCDHGDLLYAWSASFGPRIWDGGIVIYHYHIWKIIPDEKVILKEYLFYFLEWDKDLIKAEQGTGSTMIHVTKASMEKRKLPLSHKNEQQKIVTLLDKAFADIKQARLNTEQNLRNARELFESYLQQVFSERGDGWKTVKVGDISELISGQHIEAKNYNADGKGIGYLTGPSDFGRLFPIVTKWTEYPKKTARNGDILITVKGSGVGKINTMVDSELAISRQLMAIRANEGISKLLYWVLYVNYEYFQSLANGAAIPGISRVDVLNLEFSLPIHNQEEINSNIEVMYQKVNELENIYNKKLAALDELKQSLLQQAFTGQLTQG